jgi:hypothetical protein
MAVLSGEIAMPTGRVPRGWSATRTTSVQQTLPGWLRTP